MRSKIIEDYIDKMPPKKLKELNKKIEEDLKYLTDLEEQGKIFGTDTSITLDIVKEANFKPIGICWYGGEETLIFKTKKEANIAYKRLEKQQKRVYAWWYSKKDFEKEVAENLEFYTPSKIYWL